MLLLMATSTFELGRWHYSSPQQCYLCCLRTIGKKSKQHIWIINHWLSIIIFCYLYALLHMYELMKAWKWNNGLKLSTSEIKACYLPQRLQEKAVTCRYDTKYRLTCNLHLLNFTLWPVMVWFCTTNIDISGNMLVRAPSNRGMIDR